jgi:hypothetical protein
VAEIIFMARVILRVLLREVIFLLICFKLGMVLTTS